ncbi:hypothetical protein ACFO1B_54905 [Dactylosporangium siamense]|uniref:Uncharacterized protein n=1 Tax=Dactylosporangium siamense TaxID=685454 RepID=A0A919PZK9_9ACTN|nr:hypothetical protein [Dactylosporangium siamense]GIG51608.1 hypothetical protein Dsi01nite_096490 [Dactylosporangium siamense]
MFIVPTFPASVSPLPTAKVSRLTRTKPGSRAETDAVALSLLAVLADLPADSPDRPRVRSRLIELYVPIA